MIELTMLPARDGDCLLLRYGDGADLRTVLIDAGRAATYPKIKPVLAALEPPRIDLLVVTHVDQDHVLGVLKLLDDAHHVAVGEVWFNGYDHLLDVTLETFGARDGERLTTLLLDQRLPWNATVGQRSVEVGRVMPTAAFGARLDVVAPDRRLLERLVPVWEKECRKHGLIPGAAARRPPAPPGFEQMGRLDIEALAATPFDADGSATNASSIGFLFEHEGVRLLFTGDGDDHRLVESLRPLAQAEGGRLRLDAMKVAHHGSAANVSRDLLDIVDCRRYLISTDGSRHGHPDPVAMARILVHGRGPKELVFNYRKRAQLWDDEEWKARYDYTVLMPPDGGEDGVVRLTW